MKTGKRRFGVAATAAVIVVAAVIGARLIGGSTVTFAEVIRPILNANTAVFDIVLGAEDANAPLLHDMVMGSRIRRTLSNAPGNVSVIDLQARRILKLDETRREATYINLKGLPSTANYLDGIKTLIVKLQDSATMVVEDLGAREMDGRKVVGFLAKNPNLETTIWADAKTGLPVRIEKKERQLQAVIKNVRFDVPMDESLFSMEVPAGYKQQEVDWDLLGATEADFIEGLRVLAEVVGDGQFPDGVAVDDAVKQVPIIGKKLERLPVSDEEKMALRTKIQKRLVFLRPFRGEGKWYYRGKGVKLGEADKPIFWYRPWGSKTYRVIYGDLHVADVAPESLPEPLAPDDGAEPSIGYQPWSKPDFVGTQEDLWRITASGQIIIQSRITLRKGPHGVSVMPITLPYATGMLTSVSLGDTPVPFELAGAGQYTLQLPLDKLLAGQTKVTCTWTLVLPDLEKDSQNVPRKSLIPVIYYELAISVEADSGWEYVGDPTQSSWVTFTRGTPEPLTDFSVGGLGIQKRK